VSEERRLPDPGLSVHQRHPALSGARARQQGGERLELGLSFEELDLGGRVNQGPR
jgi:hypothetical protein